MIELGSGPSIQAIPRGIVYVPQAYKDAGPIGGEGEVSVEQQLFTLMRLHPHQGRKGMQWNDKLAEVAWQRCRDQAERGWTKHIDPDGYGPNHWVRTVGKYRLPDWYSKERDANSIESVAHNGDGRPDGVWASWLNSPGHRVHVLGLDPFYAAQTQVGIGFYALASSAKRFYWSVITCPPEGE